MSNELLCVQSRLTLHLRGSDLPFQTIAPPLQFPFAKPESNVTFQSEKHGEIFSHPQEHVLCHFQPRRRRSGINSILPLARLGPSFLSVFEQREGSLGKTSRCSFSDRGLRPLGGMRVLNRDKTGDI